MFFQLNYHVPEIVANKDITFKENIDNLVDERAYINKPAEYIREKIIRFSNEQAELSWPPNSQELTSEKTEPPDRLTDFLNGIINVFQHEKKVVSK